MANSQLVGNKYVVPKTIKRLFSLYLRRNEIDGNTEGYKRAKYISQNGQLSYDDLKNIKGDMEKYWQTKNKVSWDLLQGQNFYNWVCQTLNHNRENVEKKKELNSNVLDNQHIKSHEKNNNPMKVNTSLLEHTKIIKLIISENVTRNFISKIK